MSHLKTTYLNAVINTDGRPLIYDLREWAEKSLSVEEFQEYTQNLNYLANVIDNAKAQNKTFASEEITETLTTQYNSKITISVGMSYTYNNEPPDPLIKYDYWYNRMNEDANVVKSHPIKAEIIG